MWSRSCFQSFSRKTRPSQRLCRIKSGRLRRAVRYYGEWPVLCETFVDDSGNHDDGHGWAHHALWQPADRDHDLAQQKDYMFTNRLVSCWVWRLQFASSPSCAYERTVRDIWSLHLRHFYLFACPLSGNHNQYPLPASSFHKAMNRCANWRLYYFASMQINIIKWYNNSFHTVFLHQTILPAYLLFWRDMTVEIYIG